MDKDIDFLFEIGSLRFVDRTWKQFMHCDVANNAEHSFRVAWLALYLAKKEGANEARVLKMALMHDVSETRTGDVNYLSRMYTTRDDESALKDTLAGTSFEEDFTELMSEYKKRESLESQIVKDADNLDVDFEIQEHIRAGNDLGALWVEDRRKGVYPKLFTATARNIFDAVYAHDPMRWHSTAKNRHTAGDFRPSADA